MARPHRAVALLAFGALVGLGMAALGLLTARPQAGDALASGVAARVNGVEIERGKLVRLVAGLEDNLGRKATSKELHHVLDRLIEEELLVQRGLELGLARHDRGVRAKLVSAMLEEITSNASESEPTDRDLRSFYANEINFFTTPPRLRVARITLRERDPGVTSPSDELMQRVRAARQRLERGTQLATVREQLGDAQVAAIPNALLPPAKLREYVGPTALKAVEALAIGELTPAIPLGQGVELIQLLERTPAETPPFEAIEARVRAEWSRRAGDRALRRDLDELRENAQVVIASDLQ